MLCLKAVSIYLDGWNRCSLGKEESIDHIDDLVLGVFYGVHEFRVGGIVGRF